MTRAEVKAWSHSTPVQLGLVIAAVSAVFAAGATWGKVEAHDKDIASNVADIQKHTSDIQAIRELVVELSSISKQHAILIAEIRNERRYSPGG